MPNRPRAAKAALAALVTAGALAAIPSAAHAAPHASAPTDSRAKGYVGFCSPTGQQITAGSTTTGPFVWSTVSSEPAPTGVQGGGQSALTTLFQVQPGVDPELWSGDELTAQTAYTQTAHPVAQATSKDLSLASLLAEYPPTSGGYYEVRMTYSKLNAAADPTGTYAGTIIQVTGTSWREVGGGAVPCAAAKGATSSEVKLGVAAAAPAPGYEAEVASAQHAATSSSSSGSSASKAKGSSSGSSGSTSTSGGSSAADAARTSPSGSSSTPAVVGGIAAGVVLIGAGGLYVRRRRSS